MKVLWVKTELLHPLDKGGKIRTFNIVKHLARVSDLTYLCLQQSAEEDWARCELEKYVASVVTVPKRLVDKASLKHYRDVFVSLFGCAPYTVRKYADPCLADALCRLLEKESFDCIVCDFLAPSMNFNTEIRKRSVLFQHNVEAIIWQRHWQTQSNFLMKIVSFLEYRKLLSYEKRACLEFGKVLTVSQDDSAWFRQQYGLASSTTIPTGVDIEFFRPSAQASDPNVIVFTGSMDWLPNIDAVVWFCREILPLVKRVFPGVVFYAVGRRPVAEIVQLGEKNPSIIVTGDVDDIRPFLAQASVFVVPIRIGGGTRLKIFEAMAVGNPVVSTTIGAEGLPVVDGKDVLLADDPLFFSECIVRLLNDRTLAKLLGVAARRKVEENFSWKKVANNFLEAIR